MFDPADREILARYWYAVARSADVGDGPVAARLLDQDLVVYRAADGIVVADDLCPHRGVPLSLGSGTGNGGLTCAYHGLRFGAGGRCEAVPAHPGSRIPDRLHLRPYPAVERYGLVWTCVGEPAGEIPGFPEYDEPGFQRVVLPPFDVGAFAGRQVEGFLDVAHFAFVHTGSFADPDDTAVPPYRTEPAPFGFTVDYWSTVANFGSGTENPFPGAQWLRAYAMHLPFTPTLVIHFPDGGRLGILNAATPVGPKRTRLFGVIAKDVFLDQTEDEIVEFNLRVFDEDRVIVEAQRPENLPTDPRIEVNIPADRSSVAYRRALRDLGLGAFFTV